MSTLKHTRTRFTVSQCTHSSYSVCYHFHYLLLSVKLCNILENITQTFLLNTIRESNNHLNASIFFVLEEEAHGKNWGTCVWISSSRNKPTQGCLRYMIAFLSHFLSLFLVNSKNKGKSKKKRNNRFYYFTGKFRVFWREKRKHFRHPAPIFKLHTFLPSSHTFGIFIFPFLFLQTRGKNRCTVLIRILSFFTANGIWIHRIII